MDHSADAMISVRGLWVSCSVKVLCRCVFVASRGVLGQFSCSAGYDFATNQASINLAAFFSSLPADTAGANAAARTLHAYPFPSHHLEWIWRTISGVIFREWHRT